MSSPCASGILNPLTSHAASLGGRGGRGGKPCPQRETHRGPKSHTPCPVPACLPALLSLLPSSVSLRTSGPSRPGWRSWLDWEGCEEGGVDDGDGFTERQECVVCVVCVRLLGGTAGAGRV